MKTLKIGDKLEVQGWRWSNQSLHSLREARERYEEKIAAHERDFAWCAADCVVIDGRKKAPRIEVALEERFIVEGYGVYCLQRPRSGDSLELVLLAGREGVVSHDEGQRILDEARERKQPNG